MELNVLYIKLSTNIHTKMTNEMRKFSAIILDHCKPRVVIMTLCRQWWNRRVSFWQPRYMWQTVTPRWCQQMETISALLALCAGNSPVTGEFPVQRPVTRSFDFLFDLLLNRRLSKQSWGWWFETPTRLLWRHCDDITRSCMHYSTI